MAQLFFGSYLGWLPISDRASPITQATLETHTNIYTIDAIIDRDWGALRTPQAPDPARRHARARHGGRVHPPDSRQRHEDDEGRLHRGCTCPRNRRALGRVPPRLQERARPGHHDRRPDDGAAARRSDPDRDDLQLARHRATSWSRISSNRDYAAVQGIIIVFALVVVVVSLIIDFVNAFIDPRIRY